VRHDRRLPQIFSACRTSGVLQGYCDAVRCGPYFDAGALFATCEIGSSSTGSCIPTLTPGLGLFYASGAAPEGAECSMTRPAGGGADMLCGPQLTCVGINPLGTFCKPLCSPMTSIPGPACAQGDLCLSVDPYSDTGACFQSCAGTGVCPPGTTCANFQSADGQAIVCLP